MELLWRPHIVLALSLGDHVLTWQTKDSPPVRPSVARWGGTGPSLVCRGTFLARRRAKEGLAEEGLYSNNMLYGCHGDLCWDNYYVTICRLIKIEKRQYFVLWYLHKIIIDKKGELTSNYASFIYCRRNKTNKIKSKLILKL